jgi:nucleoporin SEH1
VSIDIKNVANVYTYLAAIDRLGLVTIYVPESPDKFDSWRRLAQFPVCSPPPSNGEETSFKVRWDPNLTSLAYYAGLTDERATLGLVVTALDHVKVYHAPFPSPSSGGGVSFIEIASLAPTPKVLVRDVQWAPFNVRGVDLIATASKNGDVSILEVSHAANPESAPSAEGKTEGEGEFPRQASARPAPQSSLTTAIAGRNNNNGTPAGSRPATSPASRALPYSTQIRIATTLANAHEDAWSVGWDPAGQVLMTNGSEGRTSMWKKSILEGQWKEFSSTEFEVKDSEEGEDWVT